MKEGVILLARGDVYSQRIEKPTKMKKLKYILVIS